LFFIEDERILGVLSCEFWGFSGRCWNSRLAIGVVFNLLEFHGSWLAPLSSKRKKKKKVGDVRGERRESLGFFFFFSSYFREETTYKGWAISALISFTEYPYIISLSESERAIERGLHRAQREREREDEYLELRRYGSQAHQRDPLVRRQFHQPSGAQPHCSVSPSFSQSSLYSGVFF
jgi:hypothetical protein